MVSRAAYQAFSDRTWDRKIRDEFHMGLKDVRHPFISNPGAKCAWLEYIRSDVCKLNMNECVGIDKHSRMYAIRIMANLPIDLVRHYDSKNQLLKLHELCALFSHPNMKSEYKYERNHMRFLDLVRKCYNDMDCTVFVEYIFKYGVRNWMKPDVVRKKSVMSDDLQAIISDIWSTRNDIFMRNEAFMLKVMYYGESVIYAIYKTHGIATTMEYIRNFVHVCDTKKPMFSYLYVVEMLCMLEQHAQAMVALNLFGMFDTGSICAFFKSFKSKVHKKQIIDTFNYMLSYDGYGINMKRVARDIGIV